MNTQQLISQSQSIFTNVEQVSDNLYKGNLPIQNKIAGIYYLNFSQNISQAEFEELQYKYIADEFYNQEESLQWNIYLLFINNNISDDLKIKILQDDKYARKLIFTEKEFLDYFKFEKSEKAELPDIVSRWKDQLNTVGLQELSSSTSYEGIVKNFLNDTSATIIQRVERNLDHIPEIKKITSISLEDNYRPFPKIRKFEFGSVNLFTGSNGVGKTSLLESIELILTGKTQRNNGKNEIPNCINAVLNDNLSDTYTHNNRFYKERGNKWYNRRFSEQGNQTFKSFNQFNFFNTDAAHQFSNAEDTEVINESLKQIILGEEFIILKDRIQKIQSRLRTELNKSSKEIGGRNVILSNNLSRIKELRNSENFGALTENIKVNILNLRYKSSYDEANYTSTNLFINEIKNELDFILSNNGVTTISRFNEAKNAVKFRITQVEESKKLYQINIQKCNEGLITKQQNENLLSKINSFAKYLEIANSSEIETLEINYKKNDAQLLIIKTLKDLNYLQQDILKLAKESKSLPEIISLKEDSCRTKNDLHNELKKEVETLQKSLSENEKLINELKNLGREIINHNLHSDNCPLCEQNILRSDLLLKIETEFTNNSVKNIINEKSKLVQGLKEEILQTESEIKNLKQYQTVVSNYLKEYEGLTLREINKSIESTIDREKNILNEKELYDKIYLELKTNGGTVSDYLQLKSELVLTYPALDISDKSILAELTDAIKKQIKLVNDEVENLKVINNQIINNLNSLLKLKEYTDSLERIEEIVRSNETKIESITYSFENLNRYLNIADDKRLIDLSKELALLNENLNTLRLITDSQNEIKNLLSTNQVIEEYLPDAKKLNSRLNNAVEVLDTLSNNSEDSILDNFFKDNLDEIKDIFTTIHSPKEFTNIEYKGNKLLLFKDEGSFEISQISTGQRAALVLSIFISLNRKLKAGPNILIFDDPVTFIDDFNALSFLDFLRYFIVKENKQIFFATANKKFSTLFKKKFEFLGENYKEFNLTR